MVHAFVFDLDGTLIDSKGVHAKAFLETVRLYCDKNIDESKVMKIIKENFGRPGNYISELLIKTFDLNTTPENFMKNKVKVFRGMINHVKLLPCVHELLYFLKSNKNILIVASYSREEEVKMLLKYFGIEKYFDLIYGYSEKRKMTKEEFLSKVRIFMKDNVGEFFMIDDFHEMLVEAREYGYIPIGVLTGKSSKEDFIRNGIKFFADLCEVREYLKRII